MTSSKNITFQSGNETLVGTIDYNTAGGKPTVLFVHGSRPGNRHYAEYLSRPLAAAGHSCLRIDLPGHGDSPGDLDASVTDMTQAAKAALGLMHPGKPLTVIGASMGGHIAVEMLAHADVRGLVVLCPALYSHQMIYAPYHIRSQAKNYFCDNSAVSTLLQNFTGHFLHIIGEHDDVIVPECTQAFHDRTDNAASREFFVISGAPHTLTKWLAQRPEQQQDVIQKVVILVERTT